MNYKEHIAIVEDFPKKGISFKDITTLLNNGEVFRSAILDMSEIAKKTGCNVIVGPESRGFIFGCPIATNLGLNFVPIRKPGKLPRETVELKYTLEYDSNTLCVHKDAVKKGDKCLIVDDLLATGGTVAAAKQLLESLGAEVVGALFLIELTELKGRETIKDLPVYALVEYPY